MQFGRLTRRWPHILLCTFIGALCSSAQASDYASDTNGWTYDGHIKYQYINTRIPDFSSFHRYTDDNMQEHNLEARLRLATRRNRWDFKSDIQFITVHSDRLLAGSLVQGGVI